MTPLQYIVSTNGLGIAIGICGDKQLALQDATLAENIYGSNHNDSLFNHLLYMPSLEAFKKFLIVKEKLLNSHRLIYANFSSLKLLAKGI